MKPALVIALLLIIVLCGLTWWLPKQRHIVNRFMDKLPYHSGPCENRCDRCREGMLHANLVILLLSVCICVLAAINGY